MSGKNTITQKRLKELLRYDTRTGVFTWAVSKGTARAGSVAGSLGSVAYILIGVDRAQYLAHRLAWLYVHGYLPPEEIDHIDHDRSNNKLSNLRLASHQGNGKNQTLRGDNTSGFCGVCWAQRDCKWLAQIRVDGRRIHLGYADTKAEAVKLREAANRKYLFHGNHGK
jgi:hypothetical protein